MGADVGVIVGAATLGLVGGSLTARPAYRLAVPAGSAPLTGCAACGQPLPRGWRGWVGPASPCGSCGSRLGPPGPLAGPFAALVAAGAAAGIAAVLPVRLLPPYLAMVVFGVLLAQIDLACARLPRQVVTPAIGAAALALAGAAAITSDWAGLARAAGGSVALGAVFLLLYLLPGDGLGFGDVRLAFLLGEFLGFLGWRELILGALLPWLINGPVVLVLLVAGRVKRRDALPFGPAMLAGALLAVLFGEWFDALGR